MPISYETLDGQYEVSSETSYGGPFIVNGDGVTVIKNGLTYRKDNKGCIWESSFSVIGPDKVQLESTIDPWVEGYNGSGLYHAMVRVHIMEISFYS